MTRLRVPAYEGQSKCTGCHKPIRLHVCPHEYDEAKAMVRLAAFLFFVFFASGLVTGKLLF